jgi:cytoskeleton protein RodZ
MDSFGEKLRTSRESLNYSIEQIARDTHISKRYLTGLEEEDFSVFPGETYLRGFLRNYAEYLGLDAEELISIYQNMKIQEQPIPMEALLDPKGPPPKMLLIGGGIGAGVVLLVLLLVLLNPFKGGTQNAQEQDQKQTEMTFTGQKTEIEVFKGFVIKVPIGSTLVSLRTDKVDDGLTLDLNGTPVAMIKGSQTEIDLDKDSVPDLTITLTDTYTEQNQRRARITLRPAGELVASPVAGTAITELTPAERDMITQGAALVLVEKPQADPISAEIVVGRTCFIIYKTDAGEREQKLVNKGETITLTATTSADIRISDAGAVKITVNGANVEMGQVGQVRARLFKWVKNGDNFQLVSFPEK